jgi:hypothetical protein
VKNTGIIKSEQEDGFDIFDGKLVLQTVFNVLLAGIKRKNCLLFCNFIAMNLFQNLRPAIFWDTDFSKLDAEEHKSYIIRRVFDIGSLEEIADLLNYYGDDAVREVLVKADRLTINAHKMAGLIFDLPPDAFACYTHIQSMKKLWQSAGV